MRRFVVVGFIALALQQQSLAQQPSLKEDGVLPVGADGKPRSGVSVCQRASNSLQPPPAGITPAPTSTKPI